MINMVLIGTGNVATHLFHAFLTTENVKVIQVYNHLEESLLPFKKHTATTTSLSQIKDADVYVICVKDDFVAETAKKISFKKGIIAHTSGSVELLKSSAHSAVFYPLQTFSKNVEVDFKEIPFCLETSNKGDNELLEGLAKSISNKVYFISSAQRKKLHLAAVFACNFVNYMYSISEDICKENQVPFDVLSALIKETAKKATLNSPKDVQTGPAVRKDQKTIQQHLDQINNADYKEIYKLLTQSIINQHE